MKYEKLFSRNLPAEVESHPGLQADTRYVFSITYTDPDTAPYEGLVDAVGKAVAINGRELAAYPPSQGHEGMRGLIAELLRENRGFSTDVDSIFLSSGAGGAIQTILDAFIDPGDVVLAEEFTYLGTLRMLLARRADVIHVRTDEDGIDTAALESAVKSLIAGGRRPKLIYTIPVYQNPMGVTLSLERREHLLDISRRYGIPVVENDSYADFRIDGPPLPPAMAGMDDEDSVIYVSAYTKLLGCGLRLGYAVVPGEVKETLARHGFGASPSHLAAMAVHGYLSTHGESYVERVRASLKLKRDAMLAALGEHFGPGCEWSTPHGGMMVWVKLPEGADTWVALDKAVEADVKYNPGPVFRAKRDGRNYLRLTYSHNTPDEIGEGIAILASVFSKEGFF